MKPITHAQKELMVEYFGVLESQLRQALKDGGAAHDAAFTEARAAQPGQEAMHVLRLGREQRTQLLIAYPQALAQHRIACHMPLQQLAGTRVVSGYLVIRDAQHAEQQGGGDAGAVAPTGAMEQR